MNFVHNKEEHEKDDDKSALDRLKETNKGVVKCRICKEDHWTTQCPYKDKIGLLKDLPGRTLFFDSPLIRFFDHLHMIIMCLDHLIEKYYRMEQKYQNVLELIK